MKAVILAAGRGTRLEPLTLDLPKCMVPVSGVPLIDRMIERIADAGIEEVIVVTGHCESKLRSHLEQAQHPVARKAICVFNERFHDWGNFYSLLVAKDAIGGDNFIKLDGDVLLAPEILPALRSAAGPGVLAIDGSNELGEEEMKARLDDSGQIVELNKTMDPKLALGESIGVERIDADISEQIFSMLAELIDRGETHEYYERAYELLMQGGMRFGYADISGARWNEIDTIEDLRAAEALVDNELSVFE